MMVILGVKHAHSCFGCGLRHSVNDQNEGVHMVVFYFKEGTFWPCLKWLHPGNWCCTGPLSLGSWSPSQERSISNQIEPYTHHFLESISSQDLNALTLCSRQVQLVLIHCFWCCLLLKQKKVEAQLLLLDGSHRYKHLCLHTGTVYVQERNGQLWLWMAFWG